MTSKSPVRACDDIDEAALTYAEVKALATGNPYIKEKMDLDIQVSKLKLLKANHTSQIYRLEDNIAKNYPKQIATLQERIEGFKKDIATYNANKPKDKEQFTMTVAGKTYEDKKEAGAALIAVCKEMKQANTAVTVGEYLGMKMSVTFDAFDKKITLSMKGEISHSVEIGSDPLGNITRIGNAMEGMTARLEEAITKLANTEKQLSTAKEEVTKPFPQEEELKLKSARLAELNALLNMDEKDDSVLDVDEDAPKPVQTEQEKDASEPVVQEATADENKAQETIAQETITQEQEEIMAATKGYEGFDTPIEEHDHNEVPPERTVAEKMVQPQIMEPDATPVTAEQLTAEHDRFMEDVDPYNHMDTVENREEYLQILAAQIKGGDAAGICEFLQGIIEEESGTEEQLVQAKSLLEKVSEYKPLAKVEEIEEQNYNQIDNVLNNGAGEKEEKKERERIHFKDKLKEKKDEIAAKKDGTEPPQEKTKKPPHHEV